nr:syntaxin of plants 52 [Tanacetum cinerariifolium]
MPRAFCSSAPSVFLMKCRVHNISKLRIDAIGIPLSATRKEKEMNRRRDMLTNMRTKVTQMASTLNMSNFGNRDSLLGPETKPADAMSRTTGLDNSGIVGLQRQIMRGLIENGIAIGGKTGRARRRPRETGGDGD